MKLGKAEAFLKCMLELASKLQLTAASQPVHQTVQALCAVGSVWFSVQ